MAEAVGLAGSIISIVTLAGQIVKGVSVLKDFIDAARDAPQDIAETLRALEDLALTVADFDNDFPQHVLDVEIARHRSRCIESCQQGVKVLESLVKELELKVGRRRLFGSVKMVLKKPTIDKLKEKLRDAQMALLLANQIYFEACRRRRDSRLIQISEQTFQAVQEIRSQFQGQLEDVTPSTLDTPQKTDHEYGKRRDITTSTWQTRSFQLRIPGRVSQRVCIEFTAWTTTYASGWSISIPIQRIHPYDGQVESTLIHGHIDDSRRLLATRYVAPHDMIGDNETALSIFQYALFGPNIGLINLLLDAGYNRKQSGPASEPAHINSIQWMRLLWRDGDLFFRGSVLDHDFNKRTLTQRLLNMTSIDDWENHVDCLGYYGAFPVFKMIVDRAKFSHGDHSIAGCLCHIFQSRSCETNDFLKIAKYIVDSKPDLSVFVSACDDKYGTLLHCLLFYWARNDLHKQGIGAQLLDERCKRIRGDVWRLRNAKTRRLCGTFINDTLRAGSDIHRFGRVSKRTALLEIVAGYCQGSPGIFNYKWIRRTFSGRLLPHIESHMWFWLETLYNCGINLITYGRKEQLLHQKEKIDQNVLIHTKYSDSNSYRLPYNGMRLVNFTYGAEPQDWKFYFTPIWRDWFIEFWDMIDHPERSMPGAWEWDLAGG